MKYKKVIMPYHIIFGILTFVLSIVTSVLGFSEKVIFALYVFTIKKYVKNFVNIIIPNPTFFYTIIGISSMSICRRKDYF